MRDRRDVRVDVGCVVLVDRLRDLAMKLQSQRGRRRVIERLRNDRMREPHLSGFSSDDQTSLHCRLELLDGFVSRMRVMRSSEKSRPITAASVRTSQQSSGNRRIRRSTISRTSLGTAQPIARSRAADLPRSAGARPRARTADCLRCAGEHVRRLVRRGLAGHCLDDLTDIGCAQADEHDAAVDRSRNSSDSTAMKAPSASSTSR